MQLTAKLVATLVKRPGRYHDGHGLILVVVNPNNASWQLRYQRNGRERWLGLGPLHTVTLKDARERARAARLQLLDGMDPIDVRRAERAKATQVVTFKAAAVRGRIESVLDWATVRGHRSGDNPARWKGHLAGVLPAPGGGCPKEALSGIAVGADRRLHG
jgi:hypothetical protein